MSKDALFKIGDSVEIILPKSKYLGYTGTIRSITTNAPPNNSVYYSINLYPTTKSKSRMVILNYKETSLKAVNLPKNNTSTLSYTSIW